MITFRTGNSSQYKKMKTDLYYSPCLLKYVYPENQLDQTEQVAKANKIIESSKTSCADVISVSEVMLDAFRLAVKDGRISDSDLHVIHYHDDTTTELSVLSSGAIAAYPNGFMDAHTDLLSKFF